MCLEIFLRDAGVQRHLFRRGLQKSVVVDVADDQLGRLAIIGIERGLVELPHQMLLQRLLRRDGIEEKLALVFLFLRAAAVTARLRHVIAPFVIEFGELIELLFEFFVAVSAVSSAVCCSGSVASSSRTGLVSISCCTRLRSSSSGA